MIDVDQEEEMTVGQCATLACLLEIAAPKPGNVHRGADFDDVTFTDFAVSAVSIAPAMDAAVDQRLGETVLRAAKSTKSRVNTNTNLGIVLLFAPIASIPGVLSVRSGIQRSLSRLTSQDANDVYQAIRLLQPGGLSTASEFDVHDRAPRDLIAAMKSAADRDMVARQYATGYREVLRQIVPWLCDQYNSGWSISHTIIHTHLQTMSHYPDSLIQRKCGEETAREAADRAATVLDAGDPWSSDYTRTLADLDFWLRSDGHRRNPGTTADLVTTGLFVALRDRQIQPPLIT